MRHTYESPHGTAYLECQSEREWHVCEIHVVPDQRGRGVASELMRRILADADREGVNLTLEVQPLEFYNRGLQFMQLKDWYSRLGFRRHGHPDCLFYQMKRESRHAEGIAA